MNKNKQKVKGMERNQEALKRLIHNRDNIIKEQAAELEGAMMWIAALAAKLGDGGDEIRIPYMDVCAYRSKSVVTRIDGDDIVIKL